AAAGGEGRCALEVAGDENVAAGVHGDAAANGEGTMGAAAVASPERGARAVQRPDKGFGTAGGGEAVAEAAAGGGRRRATEGAGDEDVAARIHGHAKALVAAAAAGLARPDQGALGIVLGHEGVVAAGAGQVAGADAGVEVDRALEDAGDVGVPLAVMG